jgi:acetyl esterase/lipase
MWFYTQFLRRLSTATKSHVISVNYRKTPEHPFPAALDDALSAFRWLLRKGYSPRSVAVLGDSAGGNLAFALSVRLAQLGEPQPAACLGLSPWLLLDPWLVAKRKTCNVPEKGNSTHQSEEHCSVGLHYERNAASNRSWSLLLPAVRAIQESALWDKGAEFLMGQYFQSHDPVDPLVSPLLVGDDLLKLFPPILIHVDKDEPLAAEAEEMAERCRSIGVPVELHMYEGTMHGMQIVNTACKMEARDSLSRIHSFLEDAWEGSPYATSCSGLISGGDMA